jgi:hypothetical protein
MLTHRRRALLATLAASLLHSPQLLADASKSKADAPCKWVFARYEPSEWEEQWYTGEWSGERSNHECEFLTSPTEVDRAVRLVRAVQGAVLRREPIPQESIGLFSRMVYAERCGSALKETGRTTSQLIEPFVGFLRDPITICPRPRGIPDDVYNTFEKGEDAAQSKRHYLIAPAAPWSQSPKNLASWRIGGFGPWEKREASKAQGPRAVQNIVMDLGASVYSGWHGIATAVGAWWIVERSKRHQVMFDWLVSFELEKLDPDILFDGVPTELLPHYVYFNHGVDKTPGGRWNPWRFLQGMGALPDDYVVVKLDIDNLDIEDALVDQILKNPALAGLIDEMYFERHAPTDYTKVTYKLFRELRTKGIRMHAWP